MKNLDDIRGEFSSAMASLGTVTRLGRPEATQYINTAMDAFDKLHEELVMIEKRNGSETESPLWLQLTPEGDAERERMNWLFIAQTLAECRKSIEANGSGRASWLDPAEQIAKFKSRKQDE